MRPLRSLILPALLAVLPAAHAEGRFDGLWGREGWWCDGDDCTPTDIRRGLALHTFEGVQLWSRGARICGTWADRRHKIYHGLLIGARLGESMIVAETQEMAFDTRFSEAKSLHEAPPLEAQSYALLYPVGAGLVIEHFDLRGTRRDQEIYSHFDAVQRQSLVPEDGFGLEKEFLAACLQGNDPAIERIRNGMPSLHPGPVQPQARPQASSGQRP